MAARAVALGILSAFVAELALPAAVVAWEPEGPRARHVVERRGAHHGPSDHHHPGCPWRGKGPCPHQKAADSARGPILTDCAEIPAAVSHGAARLLLDRGPLFDWSLHPLEIRERPVPPRVAASARPSSPEPPPPRSLPAL